MPLKWESLPDLEGRSVGSLLTHLNAPRRGHSLGFPVAEGLRPSVPSLLRSTKDRGVGKGFGVKSLPPRIEPNHELIS